MMVYPVYSGIARWLILGWLLGVFVWSGPEDNRVWPVALLAALGAVIFTAAWLTSRLGDAAFPARHLLAILTLAGAVAGAGTGPLAAGLMFFKNARHAHLLPDYPAGLMGAMIARLPAWSLAGALLGLALALIWSALLAGQSSYVEKQPGDPIV